MYTLVLAEKPDQAREYAKALSKDIEKQKSGTLVIRNSQYYPGEIHIVAARGHIMDYDLKPDKRWSFAKLPIVNPDFTFKVADSTDAKYRFKQIKQEANRANLIIIGTDADREGERIAYSILSKLPMATRKKATKRLWVNSMTAKGIQHSFQSLKDASSTINFYYEAEARAQADWLIGYNYSPAFTLDIEKQKLVGKKADSFSIGRVQTPAVKLVYDNDLAIKNFVSRPFWKITGLDEANQVTFKSKALGKIMDKAKAEEILVMISPQAQVVEVEHEDEQVSSDKLFNLTKLQAYGSKHWKKSGKQILDLCQSLYQKKYLTYPRTDCQYITNLEFAYLRENLAAYQKALNLRFNAVNLQARSKYVNDKKVQEHFAIIPTDVVPNLAKLTADERLVYETVVKRTCLMFAADYKYKLTRVIIKAGGVLLETEGKQVVDLGFKQYLSESNSEQNQLLPNYQVGQQLQIKPQLTEDKTKVPSRITEAKLIGTLFPKYSLGTPATRAGIIEKILEKKYVTKNNKGELYPTSKAEVLMNYLRTNSVADPNTTKIWEEGLKLIGQGKLDDKLFVDKIQEEIVAQVNEIKARYGK